MAASTLESDFLKAASDGNLNLLLSIALKIGIDGGRSKDYRMVTDDKGRNALHLSAAAGFTQICKVLIEKLKFDVDSRNNRGYTPLILAIKKRRHPTAVYLIENGARIDCIDHCGFTALHHAAESGQEPMLSLLLSKGAKVVPDHYSKAGTPLHIACFYKHAESVKVLLENGADPDSPTEICLSPLTLSVMGESYECMDLLLKAGANPNFSSYGNTPLVVAACKGNVGIIQHLLKAGANPDLDIFELKPIEHAALCSNVDAVKALFPRTSRISFFPDWSVDGIMNRVYSGEARAQREIKKLKVFGESKEKGREAYERKDYEMAKFWYIQANLVNPTDATVLSNRSLCWAKLNEGVHALVDAEACVNLKPRWAKAHYRMGAAFMLLNQYCMAWEAFSKALALKPNNKEIQQAQWEAVEAGRAEYKA